MNGKNGTKLINRVFLWTFIANLIIGILFYLAWCLIDMHQEIENLEAERNELIESLEGLATYKEKNGQFQADLNNVLEELIETLGKQE